MENDRPSSTDPGNPADGATTVPIPDPCAGLGIFRSGSIHHVIQRTGLGGPRKVVLANRFVIVGAIVWLPLLIISIVEGQAFGNSVAVPFLYDWSAHIRFLIVIPLFLLADVITEPQLIKTIQQFQLSKLIADEDKDSFRENVRRMAELVQSRWSDVIFLALVILFAVFEVSREPALGSTSWLYVQDGSSGQLSLAGVWFYYFGIPLYQFIFLNWLWRYMVWTKFLWRTSRIKLRLNAIHPDRSGGLGFVGIAQASFAPFILGFSSLYSSIFAKEIIFDGKELTGFTPEIAVLTALFLIFFLAPLLVFSPRLMSIRVNDLRRHGALASAAARSFTSRWIDVGDKDAQELLGSSQIDALANLATTYATIKRTRIAPIDLITALSIVFATLGPMVPLVLTVYTPIEIFEVLKDILL